MTNITEVQVVAQAAAGREVAPEAGTPVSKGKVSATQNPFVELAERHAKHVYSAQNTAVKDLMEAASKGAADDEYTIDLYILAFKTSLAKQLNVKTAAVNVYGSERKRILKVWNLTSSKIEDGEKTFGEYVVEQKLGYNKVKSLASEVIGKKSRTPKGAAGTTAKDDGRDEPKGLSEYIADITNAIGGIAALGYGRDKDFKEACVKFFDAIDRLGEVKTVPVTIPEQDEQPEVAVAA